MQQYRSLQIVVIDDDQVLCRELSFLVKQAGHRVECLNDQPPVAAILRMVPDLVIVDLSAPAYSGLETMRKLQNNRQGRKVPVIAVSANSELQFDLPDIFDFLPKPLCRERLLEDLTLLAAGKHAGAALYPPMDGESLNRFQEYLVQHSGLHFEKRNSKLLERGLMRRMRAVGAGSYLDYLEYLQSFHDSRQEFKKLLSLLTVGETFFFRYQGQFEALVQTVLPELLEKGGKNGRLRFWSAGCSTGEEPYTLAITLLEHFPQLASWDVQILATDINKRSLRKAREAVYNAHSLRMSDAEIVRKYFRKVGDFYLLDGRPKQMVQFEYLNLQTGDFPDAGAGTANVDIIFCRNVMIYFGLDTTRKLVERFANCLRPGGYLFLGHAETLSNISSRFQRVTRTGAFYYRCQPPVPPLAINKAIGSIVLPVKAPPFPQEKPIAKSPIERQPIQLLPPTPKDPAEIPLADLLQQAMQAFHREDYRTASQKYDTMLARDPLQVQALIGQGFIMANQGRYDDALILCTKVLAIDDLSPDAYFLRGLILDMQDDLEGAMAEYRKTLLLDMEFIMAHYYLGKVHWRQGRQGDAQRGLKNTVRLLEKFRDDQPIPHSGGLSKGVFLEMCREDAVRLQVQDTFKIAATRPA
jgi:chemotaxis protein methyltransferase CheR